MEKKGGKAYLAKAVWLHVEFLFSPLANLGQFLHYVKIQCLLNDCLNNNSPFVNSNNSDDDDNFLCAKNGDFVEKK